MPNVFFELKLELLIRFIFVRIIVEIFLAIRDYFTTLYA